MTNLNTVQKTHEVISIDEYLRRREINPLSVSDAQMLPPSLGDKGFGKFRVRLEQPIYRVTDYKCRA